MFGITSDIYVTQERYADYRTEAEMQRLHKLCAGSQKQHFGKRWYGRYLFELFFALGLGITNR